MVAVLLGAALLLTGACSGGGESEDVTAAGGDEGGGATSSDGNSRQLSSGTTGAATAGEIVATSAEEWRDKWIASGATATPPEVTEVDFETEVAVALFAGERPSGGWKIDPAVRVKRQGTFAAVSYEIVGPGKGCSSSQALTSPYLVLAVKGERLRFESTERTEDC
jgi:hypothetical protein